MIGRHSIFYLLAVLLMLSAASCSKTDDEEFDESLLYGTWYCGEIGLYYEFSGTHSGRFYDSSGDGKEYTWILDDDILQLRVQGETVSVTVFETYVLKSLNTSVMVCYDEQDPSTILTFRIQ